MLPNARALGRESFAGGRQEESERKRPKFPAMRQICFLGLSLLSLFQVLISVGTILRQSRNGSLFLVVGGKQRETGAEGERDREIERRREKDR